MDSSCRFPRIDSEMDKFPNPVNAEGGPVESESEISINVAVVNSGLVIAAGYAYVVIGFVADAAVVVVGVVVVAVVVDVVSGMIIRLSRQTGK